MERAGEMERAEHASRAKVLGLWAGGGVALLALVCLVAPALAFFLGGLLLVVVALHALSPTARPYAEAALRLPVGSPRQRRLRLLAAAGGGLVLLVGGSIGARVGGRMSVERVEQARRRALEEQRVDALLERARAHLGRGELAEAELLLIDAGRITAALPDLHDEVEELLEEVHAAALPER